MHSSSSRGGSNSGPGPIPPRWLHCPRKAGSLIGGKFLAFKTPLDTRYDGQVPLECRFPPRFVFDSMKSYKVKIGLWIDLCNTSRFYNRKDVEDLGTKYVKLQCRGHGETPSEEQVAAFVKVCKHFIQQNPLEIIAVHCTHGFNRTGFLISSYYVEMEDWSPEAAVIEFSKARPPGIYKADYLEELFRRYGDVTDAPAIPDLPDWCFDEEDTSADGSRVNLDDDGNQLPEAEQQQQQNGNKKNNRKYKSVFMEGVPGVTPFHQEPQLTQLQKRVQHMCHWKRGGFPGSQPVSLDRDNIRLLETRQYRVSWKADGTRYMMLLAGRDQVYFIDRDNAFFKVSNLTFLHRKDQNKHLSDTLLDGEMVIDEVNCQRFPRYLVYDIIKFEGLEVGQTEFPTRLTCIQREIVGARNTYIASGKIDKRVEPFSVRQKQFWDVCEARTLLGPKFTKESLGHEPDGLIFQPSPDPYKPGRDDNVLKWKPSSLNSVDFKLSIVKENRPGMLSKFVGELYVGSLNSPFGEIKVTKTLKALDKKIIECSWDYKTNQWVFMRERTDKSFPNAYATAEGVMKSIREPVTEEMLLTFIDQYAWKRPIIDHDLMPPPSKIAKHQ